MIYPVAIGLVLLRVIPVVVMVPFLSGPSLSAWVRAALVVAVTAVVLPAALVAAPADFEGGFIELVGLGAKELVVGCVIAVATSLVFWGVEMAGSFAERLRGAPAPRSGVNDQSTALGTVGLLLTIAVYFAVGGHLAFFAALAKSYMVVPLFSLPAQDSSGLLLGSAILAGEMFLVAALVAIPVFTAVWLTDLALGTFARLTPRWHSLLLGLPARSLVVVVIFLLSLQVTIDVAIDGALGWLGYLEIALGSPQ